MRNFKKTCKFLNKSVSLLLILLIVMTSMVSLVATGLTVSAVSTSTGATVSGEVIYFNTSLNSAWKPNDSDKLWAVFAGDDGKIINQAIQFTAAGTDLYSVTAPEGATRVQILLTNGTELPTTVPMENHKRVFFYNSESWAEPMIYFWGDDIQPEWSESQKMIRLGNTYHYYYDIDTTKYNGIIFHDGVNKQTDDLTLPSFDCGVFTWSSKSWESVPYYYKNAVVSLKDRKAGANEIYANAKGQCELSKYPYGDRDQNGSEWVQIYLYNENWPSAYVVYDYSDPYKETLKMEPIATMPGVYTAIVPSAATVKFKPNADNDAAASVVTAVNTDNVEPCYKMTSSTSYWCDLSNYKESVSHYSVGNTFGEGIYGVKATYYDYLSDAELSNGWRNPIQAGTNFNGAADDWFPFDNWNSVIKSVADSNSSWATPLYFGNFCNTTDVNGHWAYKDSQHGARGGNGYWSEIANLTRFNYGPNNSNALQGGSTSSVRGLVGTSLNADGNITSSDGTVLPYFDNQFLMDAKYGGQGVAKVIDGYFPFNTTDKGNGVTEYSFNSNGANDNVYFSWDSNNVPTAVNYGSGTSYGVKDGLQYFMNGYQSGYGIFPFNSVSTASGIGADNILVEKSTVSSSVNLNVYAWNNGGNWILPKSEITYEGKVYYCFSAKDADGCIFINGTSISSDNKLSGDLNANDLKGKICNTSGTVLSGGSNALNYGFGVRLDIDFRVPENGKLANGDDVQFTFTGDDDLWVYITDPDGNSELVLDMGGAHAKATGNINFNTMNATAYNSGITNTSGSINQNWTTDTITYEKSFNNGAKLNANETYKMTVFYMERGLIESNFQVSFTMTPAANDLRVNKEVDTTEVNPGLEDAMQDVEFGFTPSENGTTFPNSKAYTLNDNATKYSLDANGSFKLTDGDVADFGNQFTTGAKMKVSETASSTVKYNTEWKVIDRKTGATITDVNGNTASGTGLSTTEFALLDQNNSYSDALLEVDYVNTPETADLMLTKTVVDETGEITNDIKDLFGFTVYVDVTGTGNSYKAYPLQYQIKHDGGTAILNATETGYVTFKPGDEVTLLNLPVGAKYRIIEAATTGYAPYSASISAGSIDQDFSDRQVYGSIVDGGSTVDFTNQLKPTNGVIEATKLLDGESYTGKKFSFTLSGLPSMTYTENGEDKETHDLSGAASTTLVEVKDGKATFNADNSRALLRFDGADSVGKYRYKLVENAISDTDYTTDSSVYVVEINVTSVSGVLTVSAPVYYYIPVPGTTDYAPHLTDVNKVQAATFRNYTKTGIVNIEKKGTSATGEVPLQGAEFTVYKSYENGVLSDPLTDDSGATVVAVTDANGKAIIANIPIFAEDSTESNVKYQTYYLAETKAVSNYQLLAKPIEFTLPMNYEAGAVVNGQVQATAGKTYSLTYTITNDEYVMPDTSGSGVNLIFVFGGAIMLTGVCGLLYSKKNKKAKYFVRNK